MARLKRSRQRIKDIAPRKGDNDYPGYPYFDKPKGWKPPQVVRFEKLKAEYAERYAQGKGWKLMDVIYIYYRNNMTIDETALILDEDRETIIHAIDEIKQNAR